MVAKKRVKIGIMNLEDFPFQQKNLQDDTIMISKKSELPDLTLRQPGGQDHHSALTWSALGAYKPLYLPIESKKK
jgi:hypothetical protein